MRDDLVSEYLRRTFGRLYHEVRSGSINISDCVVTMGNNATISSQNISGGICAETYADTSTLSNCTVSMDSAIISANTYSGGICGENNATNATISGCTVTLGENATISATDTTSGSYSYSGGICGQNYGTNATISGCTVTLGENATISADTSSGGICGSGWSNGTISGCTVTLEAGATISATSTGSYSYSGGICGHNGTNATISECTVTLGENATISADTSSGGICGRNGNNDSTNATISGCTVTLEAGATISATSTSSYSGGICGDDDGTISGCTVTLGENATISAKSYSGGICGYNDGRIKCVDVYKDPTAKIVGNYVGNYVGQGAEPQDKIGAWHVTDMNGGIPNHAGCFYVKAGAISLSGGESYAIQTVNNIAFPSRTAFSIDTAYTDSSYFDVNERGVLSMKVGAPQKVYIVPVVIKILSQPGFLTANYRAIPSDIYIAAPLFSVESKTFSEPFNLTLTCTTPGADIYYVMNGGNMETNSILYTAPITISQTTTVEAIAVKADYASSASVTHTYTYQKPKAPTPDQPKAEVSQESEIPVTPTDFGVEELTKKSKLEATYDVPFKEGSSKKLSVKMNSDGTSMEVKGAVKLTNTKAYKELKKESFTRDILEADSITQNIQKHAVLLTISVKIGKERSDSNVTIALTPAHLDTPQIISINLTDSKKQVDYVILNGTNLCSKSKAWLEYKIDGKIKKLSASRVKERQYPPEVKSALPPNGETAVFKLHKKFHDNTLGRIDIVLDNKNGLAAQTLIP